MINAKKALISAFLPVACLLNGCATTSQPATQVMPQDVAERLAEKEMARKVANDMSATGNKHLQAVSTSIWRRISKTADQSAAEITQILREGDLDCMTVKAEEQDNLRTARIYCEPVKSPAPPEP